MSYNKKLELRILRDTLCLVSNVDCVSGLFILDCPFFFISRLFELLYIYIYLFVYCSLVYLLELSWGLYNIEFSDKNYGLKSICSSKIQSASLLNLTFTLRFCALIFQTIQCLFTYLLLLFYFNWNLSSPLIFPCYWLFRI